MYTCVSEEYERFEPTNSLAFTVLTKKKLFVYSGAGNIVPIEKCSYTFILNSLRAYHRFQIHLETTCDVTHFQPSRHHPAGGWALSG